VEVQFALDAPGARAVALAGEWSGWRALPLERRPDGAWGATVPLPRGEWRYQFVVDGAWVDDPRAAAYRPDGFGGRNALLRL
jgi:1,4-alpha-glucan branching enzyme